MKDGKIVYSYHAQITGNGKFAASLQADGQTVDTATDLKNESAARSWAETAAALHKTSLLTPASHGTMREAYGTFEL